MTEPGIAFGVRYCGAPTDAGAGPPCRQVVGLDVVDGRCPHHTEDLERRAAFRGSQVEGGREGARVSAEKRAARAPAPLTAEQVDALGQLDTPDSVRAALGTVAKWVAAGQITSAVANAITKALAEWIRASDLENDRRVITNLEREIKRLKAERADVRGTGAER